MEGGEVCGCGEEGKVCECKEGDVCGCVEGGEVF